MTHKEVLRSDGEEFPEVSERVWSVRSEAEVAVVMRRGHVAPLAGNQPNPLGDQMPINNYITDVRKHKTYG